MEAPDYAAPIVGWRVWRVVRERDTLRLLSAVYDEVWEPRREAVGECLAARAVAPHVAPDESCSCGIYAVRDVSNAARYLVGRNDPAVVHRVIGLVALWGVVVEGSDGWRASRAYPLSLWVPPRHTSGYRVGAEELVTAVGAYGASVGVLQMHVPRLIVEELRAEEERARSLAASTL